MNAPQTQSAAVRHWHAGTTATRNPSLIRKARTVDPIMHDRLARREQRRAARQRTTDEARRLARVELDLHCLHGQVLKDSLILGTSPGIPKLLPPRVAPEPTYGPPAGHPEAESLPLGAADDVMLAGWSLDLWPQHEYGQIEAEGGEQR